MRSAKIPQHLLYNRHKPRIMNVGVGIACLYSQHIHIISTLISMCFPFFFYFHSVIFVFFFSHFFFFVFPTFFSIVGYLFFYFHDACQFNIHTFTLQHCNSISGFFYISFHPFFSRPGILICFSLDENYI